MRSSFLRAVTCFSLQRLLCLLAVTRLQAEALITPVCDLVLLSLEYNTFYGYETACSWGHIFIVELFLWQDSEYGFWECVWRSRLPLPRHRSRLLELTSLLPTQHVPFVLPQFSPKLGRTSKSPLWFKSLLSSIGWQESLPTITLS